MALPPDPWHFPRPGLAIRLLDTFGQGLTSARGLFASRRMGKTEFLLQDLIPAAQAGGVLTAYANLWDNRDNPASTLVAAIAEAVAPSFLARLWRDLNAPIKSVKASGKLPGVGETTVEAALVHEQAAPAAALPAVLQELDRRGRVLLLLIDEAQVLAQAKHRDFAHALRAALDTRKQSVKVVFTGSSETALRRMFARRTEPFFNWAPLEPFERLGHAFVYALVDKVNAISKFPLDARDALAAFEALNQTPGFFRRYLERYLLHPYQGAKAALEFTQAQIFDDTGFDGLWQELRPADRELLMMIAEGVADLHGLAARRRLGQAVGKDRPVSLSMPQHALRRMQDRGLLFRVDQGEYRFEDEAFAVWLKQKALSAPDRHSAR